MAKSESAVKGFESRRRKELLAFLVVKFLKAHESFREIHDEYVDASKNGCLAGCGLYRKVKVLEESYAFDMKEKAHILFRGNNGNGKGGQGASGEMDPRRLIGELETSIESKSLDSYIGTGFHLLLILTESLYQLDQYIPEFHKEQAQIDRIEKIAKRIGYAFNADELHELEHLRALSEISLKVTADTEELTLRLMERCEALFKGTAEVIRHLIESTRENEILVQNLLQNVDLLEKVYGEGSAERIFQAICRHKRLDGRTGLEKAVNYARTRCGNVTGLPGAGKAS